MKIALKIEGLSVDAYDEDNTVIGSYKLKDLELHITVPKLIAAVTRTIEQIMLEDSKCDASN